MTEYVRTKDLISFDVEIAEVIADDAWDDVEREDLSITCAATSLLGEGVLPWYPMTNTIPHQPMDRQIDPVTLGAMCTIIEGYVEEGFSVLTWNGCSFDFPVVIGNLAEDSEHRERMARICFENHVDLGFMMVCQLGYMAKLEAMAHVLGLVGKTPGMSGKYAPPLWADTSSGASAELIAEAEAMTGLRCGTREAQEFCIEYVTRDVEATKDLGRELEQWILAALSGPVIGEAPGLRWITNKGTLSKAKWTPQSFVLTDKSDVLFPTVQQCLRSIPEPKWPKGRRGKYYSWLSKYPTVRSKYLVVE